MGKQYYCDYCDKSFADNLANRKKHINGVMHAKLKRLHYDAFRDPKIIISEELAKKPCHSYMSTGVCKFGEGCYYSHMDTQRRQELQRRIDEENQRQTKPPQQKTVPKLDDWLSKQVIKTDVCGDSDDSMVPDCDEVENVVYDIAPCLIGLSNIPVSLLPIPPGVCDELTRLEWG